MRFTDENVRYCLLAFDYWEKEFSDQFMGKQPCIGGLFHWKNVFHGAMDFPYTTEQFSAYNLLHVNITPRNLLLIPKILKKIDRNKTKLLLNVDYSTELWVNNYNNPEFFLQELDRADYIFSVEETMAELLSVQLKRNVPCIPHPSDIASIKESISDERRKLIGVMIHRYDKNYLLPWFALNNIEGINREEFITCAMGGAVAKAELTPLYEMVLDHVSYPDMIKFLSTAYMCIDAYTLRSYGRFTIDCAALGVPCICQNTVSSARRCFPNLTFEQGDMIRLSRIVRNLIHDEAFYKSVSQDAQQAAEYYNFENSRKRMLDFLNEGQ